MLCGSGTIFAMSFSGVYVKEPKSRFLVWPLVSIFRSLPCKCIHEVPALLVFINGSIQQGFTFLEE